MSDEIPPGPDQPSADTDDVTDWKAEAEKWKGLSRKYESTAKKRGDYDDLKAKADQYDALAAASQTEQERAVEAAKAEARAQALQDAAPGLVRAEFRAAAKGVLTDEQRDALLEDLDLTKYLTDKGEVDEEKVAKKVNALAPKAGGNGRGPDMGQGNRGGTGKVTAREQGLAEAEKRGYTKASTTS